ncbi:MAG: SCO family protein [Alphaproteobacteria bacterium]|nr:SCO family protein [Alphaproteobacteria bacterium]
MGTTDILRVIRYTSVALIAVLVLGSLTVGLGWFQSERSSWPSPVAGGPTVTAFQLVDQRNKPVSERDMLGRPAVVFFGFTYCPEVCPTTLASLTALLGKLGGDADKLGVFFVTVDPARDTPDVLAQYLSSFDGRIRALTGAPDQIAGLAKALGVYFARTELDGGGYTMDHTASIFLLDSKGRFVGTIAYGENGEAALAKLQRLSRGS